MTSEPLYLEETTRRTFEATVESVAGDRAVLDRTCFYPTGGGQPHDIGRLRDDTGREWRVADVTKTDEILHALDGDPPDPGTAIVGEIDWERRHAHMRYHTAQHLLSAVLLEIYDAETTGNQLYDDHAHLDCAYERFERSDLDRIEARVNELVADARPVRWYSLDRETAEASLDPARTRIHLLPDAITEVRIVEILGVDGEEPFDRTACAGTHIANTGEVGRVDVTGRRTQGASEERVEFVLR
ncbi:alanyl-tRNA editing protein [Halogeometricum sp. S1BR25-6]|uniref:Alanyl-tRNA editing protein n=1 Tax=Halogeometricum salsisoli TaxID=2950536 RepID=A0ABU2GDD1_9EURY|nr:alanyl-tRNA editing protein [Halogeometricum sp. S1BR25-6]MDS0298179.1 alanyl-tRNA editing protein [Halogeometricum sp. S1BR25-6]